MINPVHLRDNIIIPVLTMMGSHNPKLADDKAVEQLLGTAAQESDMGFWMVQDGISNGAKGLYQMEDATFYDIKDRYLERPENAALKQLLQAISPPDLNPNHLIGNHYVATFFARLKYWMRPEPLPADREGQAQYWDAWYNVNEEHGTPEEYLDSWDKFIGDRL